MKAIAREEDERDAEEIKHFEQNGPAREQTRRIRRPVRIVRCRPIEVMLFDARQQVQHTGDVMDFVAAGSIVEFGRETVL